MKHVYDMSFAEFQIRLFAWERIEFRKWEKTRFVAWHAFIGSHSNPKSMPKSMAKFLPLDTDKNNISAISEEQKKRFLEVSAEYYKQISENNG